MALYIFGCFLVLILPSNISAKRNLENPDAEKVISPKTDENPYNYLYGSVAETNLIRDRKGQYATNISFQPRYASALFIQNLLFCGNKSETFRSFSGPLVVTYKRLPHQLIQGVPCFDLIRVDRVASSPEQTAQSQ